MDSLSIFKCGRCGAEFGDYEDCQRHMENCSGRAPIWRRIKQGAVLLGAAGVLLLASATHAAPTGDQPLFGNVFHDFNGNGLMDVNEPAAIGVVVEATNYSSDDPRRWEDTSMAPMGDYRLLVPDLVNYDLRAYCTHSTGNLSSVSECWHSVQPIVINGAGRSVDVPLKPERVFVPIVCK